MDDEYLWVVAVAHQPQFMGLKKLVRLCNNITQQSSQ